MSISMQHMRRVLIHYPDAGGAFERQIEAIEANAEDQPHLCLGLSRTLMETCFKAIAQERNTPPGASFKVQAEVALSVMQHGLDGHTHEARIADAFQSLKEGISSVAEAMGRLSNIEGLRHGGLPNDPAFERSQASFFAAVADAICSFAYESHRLPRKEKLLTIEDFPEFNRWLDDSHVLEVAGFSIEASWALFNYDLDAYRTALEEWKTNETTAS